MTKYILAGGNDLHSDAYGQELAREVYGALSTRPVNVLSCFFATPLEYQSTAAETWRPWFERYFGNDIAWSYVLPERFERQIKATDVLYLHGGDNDQLLETLQDYPRFPTALEGKIVIGSSAGANYLSRYFWTRRRQQVSQGSGILPLGVMVHYETDDPGAAKTDWKRAEVQLASLGSDTVVKIREGHFWVVDQ